MSYKLRPYTSFSFPFSWKSLFCLYSEVCLTALNTYYTVIFISCLSTPGQRWHPLSANIYCVDSSETIFRIAHLYTYSLTWDAATLAKNNFYYTKNNSNQPTKQKIRSAIYRTLLIGKLLVYMFTFKKCRLGFAVPSRMLFQILCLSLMKQ